MCLQEIFLSFALEGLSISVSYLGILLLYLIFRRGISLHVFIIWRVELTCRQNFSFQIWLRGFDGIYVWFISRKRALVSLIKAMKNLKMNWTVLNKVFWANQNHSKLLIDRRHPNALYKKLLGRKMNFLERTFNSFPSDQNTILPKTNYKSLQITTSHSKD